jgi:hypothetical protein
MLSFAEKQLLRQGEFSVFVGEIRTGAEIGWVLRY